MKFLALIWHYLLETLTKANMSWLPFGLLINNCVYLLLASLIIKNVPIVGSSCEVGLYTFNGIDLLNWTLECIISDYYSKEYIGGPKGVKPISHGDKVDEEE